MPDVKLRVAQIVPCTEAEGPGKRFALWFQGCPFRCPGCCNPEMLQFEGGTPMSVEEVATQVARAAEEHNVEGITLIGGEPMAHSDSAAPLARKVQQLGLTVMVFSGYTIEGIREGDDPSMQDLLAHTDILVDGLYDRERPDTTRRWIGSENQRIHFLTERYQEDDARWQQKDTLEIRMVGGEVTINGFPAQRAKGLWKRLTESPKK
ncbi:MAG: 4Fe-4S single cluster domain-containing protein [Gemmataceae bacterium]